MEPGTNASVSHLLWKRSKHSRDVARCFSCKGPKTTWRRHQFFRDGPPPHTHTHTTPSDCLGCEHFLRLETEPTIAPRLFFFFFFFLADTFYDRDNPQELNGFGVNLGRRKVSPRMLLVTIKTWLFSRDRSLDICFSG